MLEQLVLENFQKHARKVVDLDPHCTTLIGDNEAGKSTVLRGLRWVCLNQPDGEGFITWGAERAKVSLRLDGGRAVGRVRGGRKNAYYLDGREKLSFGRGAVPEEVSALLNVGDVNFQDQLAGPFWFMLTAGEVSRELNKVINLESIDSCLADLASGVRQARDALSVREANVREFRNQLSQLDWVEEVQGDLDRLQEQSDRLDRLAEEVDLLEQTLGDCEWNEEVVARGRDFQEDFRELTGVAEDWLAKGNRLRELEDLVESAEGHQRVLEHRIPDGLIEGLRREKERLDEEGREIECLVQTLDRVEELERELSDARRSATECEKELAELMKGRCPLCKRSGTP